MLVGASARTPIRRHATCMPGWVSNRSVATSRTSGETDRRRANRRRSGLRLHRMAPCPPERRLGSAACVLHHPAPPWARVGHADHLACRAAPVMPAAQRCATRAREEEPRRTVQDPGRPQVPTQRRASHRHPLSGSPFCQVAPKKPHRKGGRSVLGRQAAVAARCGSAACPRGAPLGSWRWRASATRPAWQGPGTTSRVQRQRRVARLPRPRVAGSLGGPGRLARSGARGCTPVRERSCRGRLQVCMPLAKGGAPMAGSRHRFARAKTPDAGIPHRATGVGLGSLESRPAGDILRPRRCSVWAATRFGRNCVNAVMPCSPRRKSSPVPFVGAAPPRFACSARWPQVRAASAL